MSQVRTRFAPSPTGLLHLGNARTALFAYLYARAKKGVFVLRIEDTDQERLMEGSETGILEDLMWLGCEWDEGPDRGGPLGPYRCSERYHLYEQHLKRIGKNSRVYRCFCTPEQLDQDRKLLSSQGKILKYVGRCRDISDEESEKRAKSEEFVWRFQVDENAEPVKLKDTIRGEVEMRPDLIGDFIIFRSNGIPVFLFANAVDDALMEISHVTRGEDHLSNTFRQVLLYRALGYKEPVFAHLPMIGDSDGGKFSKRAGSLGIRKLREEGFLPSGLVNYLALLGWSPGDTSETGEVFTKSDLIDRFDLERVNKSRALFDPQKLRYLNSQHLRSMPSTELAQIEPSNDPRFNDVWVSAVELIKHDVETLKELHKVEEFLQSPDYASSKAAADILKTEDSRKVLEIASAKWTEFAKLEGSLAQGFKALTKEAGKETGLKGKSLFFPFRVALTAKEAGPELGPLIDILGADEVGSRFQRAFEFSQS